MTYTVHQENFSTSEDAKLRRKANKPLVEKRRRERMNKCLDELQGLLMEADGKVSHTKLEKADILELAVKHIRDIKRKIAHNQGQQQLQQSSRLSLQIPTPPSSPTESNFSYPSPQTVFHTNTQSTGYSAPVQLQGQLQGHSNGQYMYQANFVPGQGGVALLNQKPFDIPVVRLAARKPVPVWRPW